MALDPFQSLFSQNVTRTPDGRYFLPFANTWAGQNYKPDSNGIFNVQGQADPNDVFGTRSSKDYTSLLDYYNDYDPVAGADIASGGLQNNLNFQNATRGTYNNDFGYYVDPNSAIGNNPATTAGSKPNENGLWQALSLLAPAAGGVLGFASDGLATGGTAATDAGTISGSQGSSTLAGGGDSTLAGGTTDNYFGDYLTDPETGDVFAGGTEPPIDDFATGGTNQGVFSSPGQNGINWSEIANKYGLGAAKQLFSVFSSGGEGGQKTLGQSILGQLGGDPLSAAFSATPFLLALSEANRQGSDINSTIGRMQGLESSISGNASPYMNAILNPYDQQTGTGRASLLQDQQSRGIRGSSFGDQSLNSYDYTRDLGRGDLASKALLGSAGLQGQLMNSELGAINARNTNRNLLLGAGLGASGKLFSPQQDPFNLKTLMGLT